MPLRKKWLGQVAYKKDRGLNANNYHLNIDNDSHLDTMPRQILRSRSPAIMSKHAIFPTAIFSVALLANSLLTPVIARSDDGSLFIEEVTIIGEKITGD